MNAFFRRIGVFFLASVSGLLLGCGEASDNEAMAAEEPLMVQEISAEEAMQAWQQKTAVFIDVRTPEEYKAGHVPGAVLIPLAELEQRLPEIPREPIVLLICRSGNRSAQANLLLQQHGYCNTRSVSGGMNAWRGAIET